MFQALPQLKGEVLVSSAFGTTLNAHTKLLFSSIAGCLSQREGPSLITLNLLNGF